MTENSSANTSIQVMSRMFTLLDALAQSQKSTSLKNLSAMTGLHPSTAHRILNDLASGRLVERTGPGSYRLGLRLLELGKRVRHQLDLTEAAAPAMQALHAQNNAVVILYRRDGLDMQALARTNREKHGVSIQTLASSKTTLTETFIGRTMLLNERINMLEHICQKQGARYEEVALDLQQLRATGIARNQPSEGLAAPIHGDAGDVIGALHVQDNHSNQIEADLLAAAHSISLQMGWAPI
jgi:IclR family transcriptional regulator, carbohydrate utilization repressor